MSVTRPSNIPLAVPQQCSSGSENLAWRSEKNVVQMLETGENEAVEVVNNAPLSTKTVTLSPPALGLCLNAAGPDAIMSVTHSDSPSSSVPRTYRKSLAHPAHQAKQSAPHAPRTAKGGPLSVEQTARCRSSARASLLALSCFVPRLP